MKKKQAKATAAKRKNATRGKGRKVHAITGNAANAPTSGAKQSAWTDAAQRIAVDIVSLWYHCAEAVYHIGKEDTRFSFDRMYAQELTKLRNDGISATDIEQGSKLAVLAFKKIEAEHETQIAAWQACIEELRTFEKLFNAIQAETPDRFKTIFTNVNIITAPELIRNIKMPKPLLRSWFMDDIYREKAKNLKALLSMAFENAIQLISLMNWREEELRDERENEDLHIIRYAREHGIEVNISGASFNNAVKLWNETGRIANEGFAGIPQDLKGAEIGAELNRRIEQIENGIKETVKRYADISSKLPEEIDLQRAIERAGDKGTPTREYAECAVSFLRNVSALRGEELREHQRNRAAQVIRAKSLTVGEGARYHAAKVLEETERGGYGADGHRDTPDLQKVIQSLEQGLRKYADKLGIAGQINKGKRGRRKAAKIGPDGPSPSRGREVLP